MKLELGSTEIKSRPCTNTFIETYQRHFIKQIKQYKYNNKKNYLAQIEYQSKSNSLDWVLHGICGTEAFRFPLERKENKAKNCTEIVPVL